MELSKPKRIGLIVLIIATIVTVLLVSREPKFQGKLARAWVEDLTSDSEDSRAKAQQAVRELGSNAVPVLLEKLTTPERKWRETVAAGPLTNFIDVTTKSEARRQAKRGFMAVGGGAKPAIPELLKLLDDPNTAADAVQILKDLDNEVIPALLIAATNQESRLRAMVVVDLGYRHTNAPGVVSALAAGLKDPVPEVRSSAALALGKIPGSGESMVVALVESLTDSNAFVRTSAAQTLASYGPQASSAIPALTSLFHGTNGYQTNGLSPMVLLGQKMSAAQALRAIDPEAARSAGVPILKQTRPGYE